MVLGQVHHTFVVAQVGSELQVIDQHTAHERVLFEGLWRAWRGQSLAVQPLLIPRPVELPPHRLQILEERLDDLKTLGLDLERFGSSSIVVRSLPALIGQPDVEALVHEMIDELAAWSSASSLEARVRPLLASMACQSAVRAGRTLHAVEMRRLIDEWVQEGLPSTCPHGRRVALRLPADELAKIFGRSTAP